MVQISGVAIAINNLVVYGRYEWSCCYVIKLRCIELIALPPNLALSFDVRRLAES